jgi:FMN phosphatase YigB (HAD superfamily)
MNKINFSPNYHIFLWDLHDVILEKKLKNWFLIAIRFNKKWELIRNLNKKSFIIMATFILERLKIIKKQLVSEELVHAAKTTNNQALVELVTQICSAYSPITGTVNTITTLSNLGYKHHLGSNIGVTVYNYCKHKFADIFDFFEGVSIPFDTSEKKIVKKPHPVFFTTHLQKYNLEPNQCIFIDDRYDNVKAAINLGMHAIHFKNPEQLIKDLEKMGIL